MAFGGGGPMHAVALAEELEVPRVIVPVNSSVFSAWGMLLTDLRSDHVQTRLLKRERRAEPRWLRQFREMEREAASNASRDGILADSNALIYEYLLDMRYQGQEHTVKVPVADCAAIRSTLRRPPVAFTRCTRSDIPIVCPTRSRSSTCTWSPGLRCRNPHSPASRSPGAALRRPWSADVTVDFDAQGILEATIYDGLATRTRHGAERARGDAGGDGHAGRAARRIGSPWTTFGNYHVALGADTREAP